MQDEPADGSTGGQAADGTVRIFTTTGEAITQLIIRLQANPTNSAVDSDGWQMAMEVLSTSNMDTDGDGLLDCQDPDSDNDGHPDTTDPNRIVATAADDTATAIEDNALTLNVLDNDDYLPNNDSNNTGTTTLVNTGNGTATGTVSFNANTGELTYTPTLAEAGGTVTVEYQVCNDINTNSPATTTDDVCATATVTITVNFGDDDGDGVLNNVDICPGGDDNLDNDGDGVPDFCDEDDDNDGILDTDEGGGGGNLFINPSFEAPKVETSFISGGNDVISLTAWNIIGDIDVWDGSIFGTITADFTVGEQFIDLLGNNPAEATPFLPAGTDLSEQPGFVPNGIEQTLTGTTPGATYVLSFDYTSFFSSGVAAELFINGTLIEEIVYEDATRFISNTYTTTFTGTGSDTIRLIASISDFSNFGLIVDNFRVQLGLDTDGDGIADHFDLDSDGDGCTDVLEAGFTDGDGDGLLGSGTVTVNANGRVTSGSDGYTGTTSAVTTVGPDTDADGLVNGCDPDDDGDGVPDAVDICPGGDDTADNDNDGVPDFCDQDDDNDGILDTVECSLSPLEIIPTGVTNALPVFTISPPQPASLLIDGSGLSTEPNFLDRTHSPLFINHFYWDSPSFSGEITFNFDTGPTMDGIVLWALDTNENAGGDAGIKDFTLEVSHSGGVFISPTYTTVEPTTEGSPDFAQIFTFGTQLNGVTSIRLMFTSAWQDLGSSYVERNALNPPALPYNPMLGELRGFFNPNLDCDDDGDGIPNHVDLDSDNDGIYDVVEAGGTDANGDGLADGTVNNTTGIPSSAGTGITPIDTLNDGSFDFLNQDSDGDGCSDANEAFTNSNADGGDGGSFGTGEPQTNVNSQGLVNGANYVVGTNSAVTTVGPDTDNDGIADACDADDDNDGILDIDETINCSAIPLSDNLIIPAGTNGSSAVDNTRETPGAVFGDWEVIEGSIDFVSVGAFGWQTQGGIMIDGGDSDGKVSTTIVTTIGETYEFTFFHARHNGPVTGKSNRKSRNSGWYNTPGIFRYQ